MKFRLFPIICAALMGICASANASRLVYLVGLRHVYSVPVLPDPHELDRQGIEENYSAAVADAQKQFDTDMASIHDEEMKDGGNVHQVDRDAVQQNLEAAIADAAEKRDAQLAQFYPQSDYVINRHPEFKVDQDGPYKVVEIETAPSGDYVNVVYYRPYPTYVVLCPFGWEWGHPYAYSSWGVEIGVCHNTWITVGSPCFEPLCYGGAYVVVDAPIRRDVIYSRTSWVDGRPPVVTVQDRTRYVQNRAVLARSDYYQRTTGGQVASLATRPSVRAIISASASPSRTTSRYSHSSSGVTRSASTGSTAVSSANSRYNRIGSTTPPTGAVTPPRVTPPTGSSSRYGRPTNSTGSSTTTTPGSRYSRGTGTSGSSSSTTSSGTSRYSRGSGTSGPTTGSRYGSGSSTGGSRTGSGSPSSGRTPGSTSKPGSGSKPPSNPPAKSGGSSSDKKSGN